MKTGYYKSKGKKSLLDDENSLELLSEIAEIGNPLEMIDKVVDFEMFRSTLENKLLNTNKKKQCRS